MSYLFSPLPTNPNSLSLNTNGCHGLCWVVASGRQSLNTMRSTRRLAFYCSLIVIWNISIAHACLFDALALLIDVFLFFSFLSSFCGDFCFLWPHLNFRSEIPKREESRAKDRVISHLEAELRMQTGRAQQFRDILEQSLLSSGRCAISVSPTISLVYFCLIFSPGLFCGSFVIIHLHFGCHAAMNERFDNGIEWKFRWSSL